MQSAEERFYDKVIFTCGCWEWCGHRRRGRGQGGGDGYGRIFVGGRMLYAHRWAYEHFVGPIPVGLQIDHLCRNRGCVNPDHLEAVSPRTNCLRGTSPPAEQARRTRCIHGHALSGLNLYREPKSGNRRCRTCDHIKYLRRKETCSDG